VAGCQAKIIPTTEEEFYCSFNNMKKVQVYQEDKQLNVKAIPDATLAKEQESAFINIYIPEMVALDAVELELGAGNMEIVNLQAKNVEISVEAGKLTVGKLDAEHTDVDCSVGNVLLNAAGNVTDYNYEILCMAGNIILNGEKHTGLNEGMTIGNAASKWMDLNCTVGNMEIVFIKE
jgi:hypothetical protein